MQPASTGEWSALGGIAAGRAVARVALGAGLHRDVTMDEDGEDGLDWAFTNRELPGRGSPTG